MVSSIDYQQMVDVYGLPSNESLGPMVNPRMLGKLTLADALHEFERLPPDRRLATMISLPSELLLCEQISALCKRPDFVAIRNQRVPVSK